MEYRYMIWNDIKKEFQFPKICETTKQRRAREKQELRKELEELDYE